MRKKRTENKFKSFMGKFVPYVATFLVIFGLAKVGSESKAEAGAGSINMNAMAANDYNVSADQLSELYAVASLSNSMDLASTDTVAANYMVVSAMKEISQTSADRIEKPSVISTNISRGVQTYVVNEGETMAAIALRFGITTDQIRWSNGLKNTDVTVGQVLQIPTVPGIVYTVKGGDTPEGLAAKYGGSVENIIAYNDLEGAGLVEGAQIVLPGGVLPNTERPEYVAPTYTYSYSGFTSARQNMRVLSQGRNPSAHPTINNSGPGVDGNPMVRGQCTWYAWYWRAANGNPLPGGGYLSHARYWASRAAAAGFRVDHTPSVGAVFQTTAGYYGHVGIVIAINGDGSLLVREMNLDNRGIGTLTEGIIPASSVGGFNYIH